MADKKVELIAGESNVISVFDVDDFGVPEFSFDANSTDIYVIDEELYNRIKRVEDEYDEIQKILEKMRIDRGKEII